MPHDHDGGHGHHHDRGHDHGHAHGHGLGLGHDHHHHGDPHSRAFRIAIALNAAFVAVEFGYGVIANSTALMADAGHNLSDVLGLMLAFGATLLVRRAPNARFTYGLRSSSILAALANAAVLLVACGGIAWEAIGRFAAPPAVAGTTVMFVAAIGLLVNGVSAFLFLKGSAHDLNIRGAYLHMLADAAVSLGVVIAGAVIMLTGWFWLDPLVSLVIVAVIVAGTWGLLRESLNLALAAVPAHIDPAKVAERLKDLPGVADIHDLHIWAMSTTEAALTVHLVMPDGHPGDAGLDSITSILAREFRITHCTLQVDLGHVDHGCALDHDHRPA